MAPQRRSRAEPRSALALSLETASAIRYPRDNVPACNFEDVDRPDRFATPPPGMDGRQEPHASAKGRTRRSSPTARSRRTRWSPPSNWRPRAVSVDVIDARFCKPLDGEMLARILRPGHPVLTLEDHSLQNGFGTAVLEYAVAHDLPTEHLTRLGMPDRLIAHATRKEQLAEVGLDAAGIARTVRDAIQQVVPRILGKTREPVYIELPQGR